MCKYKWCPVCGGALHLDAIPANPRAIREEGYRLGLEQGIKAAEAYIIQNEKAPDAYGRALIVGGNLTCEAIIGALRKWRDLPMPEEKS